MLAILYDIHGNHCALEAVLADARAADAGKFLFGGDYGMLGPCPREVVAAIDAIESATVLRGNTERWVADPGAADLPNDTIAGACAFVASEIGEQATARLAALPDSLELDGDVYAHASPLSDMRGFAAEPGAGEDELVAGVTTPMLVVGHTHQQFRRRVGDVEVINPGSVGFPFDGDWRAAYALRDDDGEIELRRVEYDRERSEAQLAKLGRDRREHWVETAILRLRNARP